MIHSHTTELRPPDAAPDQPPAVYVGRDMSPDMLADVADRLRELGVDVLAEPAPEPGAVGRARVIVVVAPKGGSGKTAIGSNLAVALAERHPGRVVVVDLDVQFGNMGLALATTASHTLAQLTRSGRIDPTSLKLHLTSAPHELFLLDGATDPVDAESVHHTHVSQVLPLLARSFDYVVVDTSAGLDERTVAALECATDMLMVSSLDVASIRSLRAGLDALDKLGITANRQLVLNRADSKVGLNPADAEEVLGMPVTCSIPSTREIPLSLNLGTPVVANQPKAPVAKQLRQLAELYSPTPDSGDARKRRWRR